MSSINTNISNIQCCPQSTGEDPTKYYKIAALVLRFSLCSAITVGLLAVSSAIRVLANARPRRTRHNLNVEARAKGKKLGGSRWSSFRRTLRQECSHAWETNLRLQKSRYPPLQRHVVTTGPEVDSAIAPLRAAIISVCG
ncbi:hypothetical protein C8T65DRAFT_693849 [Cerioporus squamosus]|nr:hypothetical protein C8T65DRAFT_693849 [Cerioporus squamosus]